MEQYYKITYLRKKYNISTRTLRWYEEKGLIQSLRVPEYSYRVYTATTVRQLEYILYFRKMGVGLQEISAILSRNTPEEIHALIQKKRFEIDDQINRLNQQRNAILGNLTGFSQPLDSEKDRYLATIQRGETTTLSFTDLVSTEHGMSEQVPTQIFHQIQGNHITLWDRERCVFTAEHFAPPFTLHITAKTDSENLRLYYGSLELIFRWEFDSNMMVFYDHAHSSILKIPVGNRIPADQFVTIHWHISDACIACSIDDTLCFSLERPFASLEAGPLGFGTLAGNRVTVTKAILSTPDQNHQQLDLTKIQSKPVITEMNENGELVVCHSGDTQQMTCCVPYTVPFEYVAVAKVSNENLRLYFHHGMLILNWEKRRLFWRDPLTGEERIFQGLGYISPNQFHTIRQIFDHDTYVLEIDGIAQLLLHDAPYMKHPTPLTGKVGIGTAFGNTVTVQRLSITPLGKK